MNLSDLENLTENDVLALKQKYDDFVDSFTKINKQYEADLDQSNLEKSLYALARKNKKYNIVAMGYVNYGDELIEKGQREIGIRYLQIAMEVFGEYADEVTCFLRLAEYHIEKGETETGIDYLMKLCCETVSNYEESIGFRELTHVWEKYKHLVVDKVPVFADTLSNTPLQPEACTMQIADILLLPEDSLLLELSTHLYEMSGCGERANYLNKWERLVFYLDMLCVDINSDGLEHFVEYHGHRFKQTKKAMEELGLENGVKLLDMVQKKIKKHEEDFEEEEAFYYEFVEKDLLAGLHEYVLQNKARFR